MRRLLPILSLSIVILLFTTCGDDGPAERDPMISEIHPESGPPGTSVTISGSDFSPTLSENTVTFNEISAEVQEAGESQLVAAVPDSAETGPVTVTVDGNTASGPQFTVESEAPGISSVEPDSGTVGTEVTIGGMNFSSTASANTITFAGTEASVNSAAEDQLLTEVPQGAGDGPVEVTVDGKTATGPDFDVITDGTLEAVVSTSGSDQDSDGYTLTVDGAEHSIGADETVTIEELEEGSYDAELSGVADNCSVDGDNPQQVDITAGDTTTTSFDISCMAVLNNQIVFFSDRDNADGDLYVTNPDGTGQERLTDDADTQIAPAISPDGTKIAYTNSSDGNIYAINADGTNSTQLTNTSASDYRPHWSPDGSRIVFTTDRDGDFEVYIMDADGSDPTNLTNSPGSVDQLGTWSPDGDRIVFVSDRDADGDYEIYTVNTEGTALQKLTDNAEEDTQPIYSPGGSQIAFRSFRDGNTEIYVMDADGSNQQQVTNNSANFPSWSPDGNRLTFRSHRDGNSEIYVINTDGTGVINLTVHPATDVYPFWSPIE